MGGCPCESFTTVNPYTPVPDPAPQGRWTIEGARSIKFDGIDLWALVQDAWFGYKSRPRHDRTPLTTEAWDALVELVRRAEQPEPTAEQVEEWLEANDLLAVAGDDLANVLAAVAAIRGGEG